MKASELPGTTWRKSSHSGANEDNCVEITSFWRKSSRSGANEDSCVEVARADRLVAVRDSKHPHDEMLVFSRTGLHALLTGIKTAR
jgi:hypothetical protein